MAATAPSFAPAAPCLTLSPSVRMPAPDKGDTLTTSIRKIKLREGTNTAALFGSHDRHLKMLEEAFGVRMAARGDEVVLDGQPDAVSKAERALTELAALTIEGYELRPEDVALALKASRGPQETPLKDLLLGSVPVATRKRFVSPKSAAQQRWSRNRTTCS